MKKIFFSFLALSLIISFVIPSMSKAEERTFDNINTNESYKDAKTVDEFLNSKEPVSIDYNSLSPKEQKRFLEKTAVKTSSRSADGKTVTTYAKKCSPKKKNFSYKFSNKQIKNSAGIGGIGTVWGFVKNVLVKRIAAPISIGSGIALAGATINGWTGGKGIVVKGYSKNRMVRENPYQLPKCKRVGTVTSIKRY